MHRAHATVRTHLTTPPQLRVLTNCDALIHHNALVHILQQLRVEQRGRTRTQSTRTIHHHINTHRPHRSRWYLHLRLVLDPHLLQRIPGAAGLVRQLVHDACPHPRPADTPSPSPPARYIKTNVKHIQTQAFVCLRSPHVGGQYSPFRLTGAWLRDAGCDQKGSQLAFRNVSHWSSQLLPQLLTRMANCSGNRLKSLCSITAVM
jgi:hypothetical protein